MLTATSEEFNNRLAETITALRSAKKRKVKLSSTSYYAKKARSALASLRKSFIAFQRDYPPERYPKVAFQLATIEPLLQRMITTYPAHPSELLALADEITFKVQSDLAAELESTALPLTISGQPPFLPNDLIEDRQYILKKVLWEINRSYDSACYNSCAAMIRRLTESLIIDAFEHLGLGDKIKKDGDYQEFLVLIGKAIAEPALRLTRNTKRLLPDLKFFGDLAVHNRNALVRKDDLDKFHQAIRSAVEELTRSI